MAPHRTPEPEPWPPPMARWIAFYFGLGLIVWEITVDHLQHMEVFGLSLILTGLPLARGLEKVIDLLLTLRGGGPK